MKNSIQLTLENSIAFWSFENFKSTMLHRLHKTAPKDFVKEVINNNMIEKELDDKQYLFANYLYALCVYLIKENNLKERVHLKETYLTKKYVFPIDSITQAYVFKNNSYLYDAYNKAIPIFLKFKIIEVTL